VRLTRRSVLRAGTLAAVSPLLGQAPLPATPAHTHDSEPQWRHGLSLFGDLKYPAGFRHFDYVNPQAPKGGVVRLMALGSFDNFNQAIAGLKGLFGGCCEQTVEERAIARLTQQKVEIVTHEAVTAAEATWLAERIGRDGKTTANERALLAFLKTESPSIDPALRALVERAAVAV